jgi:DNA repair ATPase RecN
MSNQLYINKIIIEGDQYRRTFSFSKGLNVIKGEFYSGKSLLLNLINYSFGRKEKFKPQVQKELKEYCNKVYMEIEINNKTYTVLRNLWHSTETIFIFFSSYINIENYSPRTVSLNEFYKFLLECINIPEFSLLKHKKHSLEKELEKISFRDLMRFVYIDQHD